VARTPQEVLGHHGDALAAGDLDGIDTLLVGADGIRVQTIHCTPVR
jgi:hypothetical protein